MGIFHRKKKANNGTSAPPNDHGQGSSREEYRERHRRPSRVDDLRNDLAVTMRTVRGEPPAPPDEDQYASIDDSAHHEYAPLDDSAHYGSAYHDNPEDCVDYAEQPNEPLWMHKPLSILRKRRGFHERYRPWEEECADHEWLRMSKRMGRTITPDSVHSVHSWGSELRFEGRHSKRPERQVDEDPAWEQDGLDDRPASWGEGSQTAGPVNVNTEYDLPEEDCSFGSGQPFIATDWDEDDEHYTAGPVNEEYNRHQQGASSSRFIRPIGWETGQPLQAAEYPASNAQQAQSTYPAEAEHDGHHDETYPLTADEYWMNFFLRQNYHPHCHAQAYH